MVSVPVSPLLVVFTPALVGGSTFFSRPKLEVGVSVFVIESTELKELTDEVDNKDGEADTDIEGGGRVADDFGIIGPGGACLLDEVAEKPGEEGGGGRTAWCFLVDPDFLADRNVDGRQSFQPCCPA